MNKFEWVSRYSETDEPDKHGRWARLCYYNGLMIAWIERHELMFGNYIYTVTDYFPSIKNDNPCFVGQHKNFDYAKSDVEKRFVNFLKTVQQKQKTTIQQRKEKFTLELNKFSGQYERKMLIEFFEYWTEHGINDRKMRFEKEKSFGLSRRLATWKRNQERYENRKINSNRFESDTTKRTIENFRQRVEQKG